MLARGPGALTALAVAAAFVAGCGGSSRMSKSEYRAGLAKVAKDANNAYPEIEKALAAKTVAQFRTHLSAFGVAMDKLGDEVDALRPPKDAEKANGELAAGEHDTAAAIRALIPKLSGFTTAKAAIAGISKDPAAVKAGNEQDDALTTLRKLGYTKGS